jgi:LmbE family N-acetylglucosaminyl deacetylase
MSFHEAFYTPGVAGSGDALRRDMPAPAGWSAKDFLFPARLDLGLAPLMQAFRDHPIVVLSPHFDDACFSLGAFLAAAGHGTVLNVFTHGGYLAQRWAAEGLDQARIHAIRDGEDAEFARHCGLVRIDLGCEEPPLRGRRVHDLSGVADDLRQIGTAVTAALEKISHGFAPGERGFLFAPLAVGRHCNHHALRELVLRDYPRLSCNFDILFYEDQPYSESFFARLGAWSQLSRRVNAVAAARYVFTPLWNEKRALVAHYPTQLRRRPAARRFWPRALSPLAPHEAFWSFPLHGLRMSAE